jgi:hypothetical protein
MNLLDLSKIRVLNRGIGREKALVPSLRLFTQSRIELCWNLCGEIELLDEFSLRRGFPTDDVPLFFSYFLNFLIRFDLLFFRIGILLLFRELLNE